jgi:hypothetical protein
VSRDERWIKVRSVPDILYAPGYLFAFRGTNADTDRYEYHWCDGVTFKKPVKVSAPEYADYLMTWVQEQMDDEVVFPSKIGT